MFGGDATPDFGPLAYGRLRHTQQVCQRRFAANDGGGFRKGMGVHAVSVDFLHKRVNTFYPNK